MYRFNVCFICVSLLQNENRIKQLTGAKYAGSNVMELPPLHMTLLASGMQEGDEIIRRR